MQKKTEGSLSHTAAFEQIDSHAMPRVNNVYPEMFCMVIFLAASSSPQSGVLLCLLFMFAFHCSWASTNIPQSGPSPTWAERSPHPSISVALVLH